MAVIHSADVPAFPSQLTLPDGVVAARDTSRLLICLAEGASEGAPVLTDLTRRSLASFGVAIDGDAGPNGHPHALFAINHGPELIWLRLTGATPTEPPLEKIAAALDRPLRWMAPVFRLPQAPERDALFAARPDVLLLRPAGGDTRTVDAAIATHHLIEHVERSQRLGGWRFFELPDPSRLDALTLASALHRPSAAHVAVYRPTPRTLDVYLDYVPWRSPFAFEPNDTYFDRQWGMLRIGAPDAWDIETGARRVVVAVADSGCDLAHADLRHAYVSAGINTDDPALDGSPVIHAPTGIANFHGTAVAGVIAAALDNNTGVAGLASGCGLLPIAMPTGGTTSMAEAIAYAVAERVSVLNLSVAIGSHWFETLVRPALDAAVAADIVVCASAGNGDMPRIVTPARYAAVMACGGSDKDDRRWSAPPDGAHWGDEIYLGAPIGISVVAPAVDIVTTDVTGPAGFTPGASPIGDYVHNSPTIPAAFGATSAAAPHVAGAAALVRSAYPSLSAVETRRTIERTAEKVGGYTYVDVSGYPNGPRHAEMGYGRLNVSRALDFGDVLIRDWPGDEGAEPSTPPGGNFYGFSDIVIRPGDDDVFAPESPELASAIARGLDHTATVRVVNRGPAAARDVRVDLRATPWAGTEFRYPDDWTAVDPLHVQPTALVADPFDLPAGHERLVRFRFSADQIDQLAGWTDMRWHPCLLGMVRTANDYAFSDAPVGAGIHTVRRNNLAQRNLTVVTLTDRSAMFPFVIGHPANKDATLTLAIDAAALPPGGELHLVIDDASEAFPVARKAQAFAGHGLKAGRIAGGKLVHLGQQRAVHITGRRAIIELAQPYAGRHAVSLHVRLPKPAAIGKPFQIAIAQITSQQVAGGVSVVFVPEA